MSRTLSRVERDYDLGIVINPDVGDDLARATVERISQTIATNGGRLVRVNAVGRRRLAYPIEHHRDGQEGRQRTGYPLPGDVGSRAVDGLEH